MSPLAAIGFDADDTLWENEAHYTASKQRFAALFVPGHSAASALAVLDEIEVRNVGVYGYGIKSFTLSMIEAAAQLAEGGMTADLIEPILRISREMLETPITFIDGARDVLAALAPRYRLLLLTKGDLFEQELKIRRSGVAPLFAERRILSQKTTEVYRRVLEECGISPGEFLMVGNSIRSDVQPVVEIGARAVLIPHPLTWSHETSSMEGWPSDRWFEITTLADLPSLLDALDSR